MWVLFSGQVVATDPNYCDWWVGEHENWACNHGIPPWLPAWKQPGYLGSLLPGLVTLLSKWWALH
jgi:hypothetical protein